MTLSSISQACLSVVVVVGDGPEIDGDGPEIDGDGPDGVLCIHQDIWEVKIVSSRISDLTLDYESSYFTDLESCQID